MFNRILLLLSFLLFLAVPVCCCLNAVSDGPRRFSNKYDIGEGRTLRVWSTRDSPLFGPNALMVYYRVDQSSKELVHETFLGHDDGGVYEFKLVFAKDGRLSCVYETNRAVNNHFMLLIFDAESGESWPRLQDVEKWRKRYDTLKAENPDLPTPMVFR